MIDPKELRIGAHYYNGSYVEPIIGRVLSIDGSVSNPDDIQVGLIYDMPLDKDSDPYEAAMAHYLEPIPITAELLTELGFEKAPFKSYRRDLGESEPFMHFHYIADGCWRMEVSDDTRNYGNIVCKYLHQVEAFLYLTTKTELIKE